jgi:hypothetical protein
MKTRKRKPVALEVGFPATGNPPENSVIPDPELLPSPESEREKPSRISFNVTPDGAPDWERMQPRTKTQLTELLQNKSVQKELGFTPEQAKKIEEIGFGEDEANALLDLLQGIDSIAASKLYGIPSEITSQAFTFSPDHRKKLGPVYARLLNKWGPAALKAWKDEIGAVVLTFAVINSQIRVMHILEEKRKKNVSPMSGPRSVTPISEPAQPRPEEKSVAVDIDPLQNTSLNA